MRAALGLVATLLCIESACGGSADPNKPHPHQGILKKYEFLPPSQIGLKNLGVTDEQLRKGEPVLRKIALPGGWQRMVSIQDVCAPEKTVWSAINDLPRYPKMVEGVTACDVYSTEKKMSGEVITCARYTLKAAGFALSYYMKHFYNPKKHCMTFHLDYSRCSDLSDSVGYWYVEDRKDGWCRVFYSTDSSLPRFIPGFAKDMITNMASKKSTAWVDTRCNELTGFGGGKVAKGGGKRRTLLGLALLGFAGWKLRERGQQQ